VKYMAKDMTNLNLPKGYRLYNNSRKLFKPVLVIDNEASEFIESLNVEHCVYQVDRKTTIYERYYVPVGSVPTVQLIKEQELKFGVK